MNSDTTILGTASDYLQHATSAEVLQSDLFFHVSHVTGYPRNSVAGTLCKQRGGLRDPSVLTALGFEHMRAPARYVRTSDPSRFVQDYDDVEKQKSRKLIADALESVGVIGKPHIATYGAQKGYCVKYFLRRFKGAQVVSIENNEATSDDFESLGLKAESFRGEMRRLLRRDSRVYDLINMDGPTFLSESSHRDVKRINREKRARVLAITFVDNKAVRAAGRWADEMRAKYKNSTDQTLDILRDTMSNYDLVSTTEYTKTNVFHGRGMRVFIFKLR